MKKTFFIVLIMIFTLGATTAFATNSDPKNGTENPAIPDKKENKLTEEEISRYIKRVEEIRDLDKRNLTAQEKTELRKELKEIKKEMRSDGPYIWVGGVLLIVLIVLLIVLLV